MARGLLGVADIIALNAIAIPVAVLALFTPWGFALLEFHPVAVDYFRGEIGPRELAAFSRAGMRFTQRELSHLADVAALLGYIRWILAGAVALVLCLCWLDGSALRRAAIASPAVFLAIGGAVVAAYFAFGFEAVGVFFHETVFPQGNWRFPWSSLIIQLYGPDVMVGGAAFVIGLSLALLLVFAALAWRGGRRGCPPIKSPK